MPHEPYNLDMPSVAQPTHRIWAHAGVGAALLLLTPTLVVAIQWELGVGGDSDMSGVLELVFFLLALWTVPVVLLSFGVMAPLALAIDRLAAGRTSRATNIIAGIAIGLTGLAAFLIGASLLAWESGQSLSQVLSRPFTARPEATAVLIAFFALVGTIVGAGMRHRTRVLN